MHLTRFKDFFFINWDIKDSIWSSSCMIYFIYYLNQTHLNPTQFKVKAKQEKQVCMNHKREPAKQCMNFFSSFSFHFDHPREISRRLPWPSMLILFIWYIAIFLNRRTERKKNTLNTMFVIHKKKWTEINTRSKKNIHTGNV